VLYEVTRGGHSIHIFGGGPPTAAAWSNARAETLASSCEEFWHEVPELGADAQAFAIKYGVDPAAPLNAWLTDDDRARVEAASVASEANAALLAPVRPWLAAQILKMAFESRNNLPREHSGEAVLARCARDGGAVILSEFAAPDGVFAYFAAMPREAEVEYLRWTMAEIEAGAETYLRDAQATADGDMREIEEKAKIMREDYPALHEALAASRNRAWVPRIETMMAARTNAFVVVGAGHLVGEDGVVELLRNAAFTVRAKD
jgi:uncharacterized protein YbaP (TraB family)